MLATRSEWLAFAKCAGGHWKEIIGGSSVFLVLGIAASLGFNVPKWITAVSVCFVVVALASFLAWRDEHREKSKLLEAQWKAKDECLNTAAGLLKNNPFFMLPMHAVYRAKAYKLVSNDDFCWICDELVRHGHDHPFSPYEIYVPPSERLEFIQWARKQNGVELSKGNSFCDAVQSWPEHKGRAEPKFILPKEVRSGVNWHLAGTDEWMSHLPPYED